MAHWRKMREEITNQSTTPEVRKRIEAVYGFPFGNEAIKKVGFFKYIPFCPSYGQKTRSEPEEQISVLLQHPAIENMDKTNTDVNIDVTNV